MPSSLILSCCAGEAFTNSSQFQCLPSPLPLKAGALPSPASARRSITRALSSRSGWLSRSHNTSVLREEGQKKQALFPGCVSPARRMASTHSALPQPHSIRGKRCATPVFEPKIMARSALPGSPASKPMRRVILLVGTPSLFAKARSNLSWGPSFPLLRASAEPVGFTRQHPKL